VIEIPGYVIKKEISMGATASVLLAEQTSLDREVALKVMAPEFVADKAHCERFLQIARTLASFAHQNIVAVYDVGVGPQQTPYFSMQYLSGGNFLARAQHGISEPDLTETLASVARALAYIHQRGLTHRAVTPENVLYDAYNTPVLIDFGVAPTPSQEAYVTSAGFAVDAGRYMSPEQARGGELSARSDIYSLGALCFLGLTGRPPFDGVDGFAVAYAHVFEAIPRLPPEKAHWQTLIDCALAKDPKDRYASVEEFLDALTKVGTGSDAAPAGFSTDAVPEPAKPAAATAKAPIAPTAPITPVPATAPARAEPRAVAKAEPMRAPKAPAGRSGWTRAWPLALAALGVLIIAVALLLPKKPAAPDSLEPAAVAPVQIAPATSSFDASASATPSNIGAAPAAPDAGAPGAANTMPASVEAGSATPASPPGDQISSIDAAEAQAESEAVDPAKAPTVVDPLNEAIKLGRIDLAGQRLTSPPGTNALERFQFALKLEPKSKGAHQGIVDIAKKYIELADRNPPDAKGGQAALAAYSQQLDKAAEVARIVPEGADVLKDIAARRRKAAEPLIVQAKSAADAWDKVAAKAAYELVLQIDPENAAARDGLKFVATIGEPGFVFRDKLADGTNSPPLVILPGGNVAFARHPVTRAEFRRFWESAGKSEFAGKEPSCRDRESIFRSSKMRSWENPDITQDENHPAVCVAWAEATAYAQWLARQTGKRYRLPSAAEFDQVASHAFKGDCTSTNIADAAFNRQFDSRDGSPCDDGFAVTSPVEHFAPVEGVYDIDGNVREWVAACGNGAAAGPGSACRDFRVKGRGWLSAAKEATTFSDTYAADVSLNTVGFRVARDTTN